MKNTIALILNIMLISGLLSCEKYIAFDEDAATSKIVLNAMISPDTSFQVHLSRSLSVIDAGNLSSISNAIVAVYDDSGILVETLIEDSMGYYNGSQLPEENVNYTIVAEALNYADVNAACAIPMLTAISEWDTLTINSSPNAAQNETEFQVSFAFTDEEQVNNFYMISVLAVQTSWGQNYSYPLYIETSDPKFGSDYADKSYEKLLFSDLLFDGETTTFNITLNDMSDMSYLILNLYSCSEEYYLYNKSYQTAVDTEGNPFAQPVQVYSNINNGHGVFGGFQVSSKIIYM
tara:strand:- start:69 stop:941 length:873 start_codon:yes stop_codon:yes gene_type:complete